MNFTEALSSLVNGKYVRRLAWEKSGEYVVIMPGMPYIWKILTQPNPSAGNWLPFVADMLADDWEVFEKVTDTTPAS